MTDKSECLPPASVLNSGKMIFYPIFIVSFENPPPANFVDAASLYLLPDTS